MIDLDKARGVVSEFQALVDKTPAEMAQVRLRSDAWTLTEIVGHLVDSASNNHQRFARLRFGDLEGFPGYEAEPWVEAQKYNGCRFEELSVLWASYNGFLLHLVENAPEEAMGNCWVTGGERVSLEFLMGDYYDHLMIHVDHYRDRLSEILG